MRRQVDVLKVAMLSFAGFIALMGLVLVVVVLSKRGGDGQPTNNPPPILADKEKPTIKMQATQLWDEYLNNAIAADEKYKGKTIEVNGGEFAMSSDSVGFVIVSAPGLTNAEYNRLSERQRKWFNKGYPPNIVCKIDPAFRSGFAKVKNRASFTIIGKCVGSHRDEEVWSGMVVVLEGCRPSEGQ